MFPPLVRFTLFFGSTLFVVHTIMHDTVFGLIAQCVDTCMFIGAFVTMCGALLADMNMVNHCIGVFASCFSLVMNIKHAWSSVFTRNMQERKMMEAAANGDIPISDYKSLDPSLSSSDDESVDDETPVVHPYDDETGGWGDNEHAD